MLYHLWCHLYSDEAERRVVDYTASTTDQYASRLVEGLY
ncbi:hypothetical protein ACFLSK_03375 [Chloroflexota bacterium]